MLYVLIVALAVQSIGFLALLDHFTARHARQVADLCQRLQAPETAVAQHVIGTPMEPSYLPFDDDAAFLSYQVQQSRPVTDGDLG